MSKSLNAIFKKTKSTDKDTDKMPAKGKMMPKGKDGMMAFISKCKKEAKD